MQLLFCLRPKSVLMHPHSLKHNLHYTFHRCCSYILLLRNQVLGLVNQIQNTAPYHGPFGVALDGSPDFTTIAAAYGIPSIVLNDENTLDEGLEQFLNTKGSCLLICDVHPDVTTND